MNWMLYHGREFEQLIQNPLLLTLLDASLGRGAVIASFSSIKKGPGPGVIPMHTDYAHVPEPYPEFSMTGVGVWALEDWRVESGPTWLMPGSHKMRRSPRPSDSKKAGCRSRCRRARWSSSRTACGIGRAIGPNPEIE